MSTMTRPSSRVYSGRLQWEDWTYALFPVTRAHVLWMVMVDDDGYVVAHDQLPSWPNSGVNQKTRANHAAKDVAKENEKGKMREQSVVDHCVRDSNAGGEADERRLGWRVSTRHDHYQKQGDRSRHAQLWTAKRVPEADETAEATWT